MSENQLLIPIKVEALVIEHEVISRKGDRHWSPIGPDYYQALSVLGRPGPLPFMGAKIENGVPDLPDDAAAVVEAGKEARGVYLHWVLPPGLRHAHRYEKDKVMEYPPLPDRWLICRFARRPGRATTVETKAWVIDSSIIGGVSAKSKASGLTVPADGSLSANVVGDPSSLADFKEKSGSRTTITAVGNASTGSPRFTASVAENGNMLSWHDDLKDLRANGDMSEEPDVSAISYLVLGSYRQKDQEPLAYLPTVLADMAGIAEGDGSAAQKGAAVLAALRWQLGTQSG